MLGIFLDYEKNSKVYFKEFVFGIFFLKRISNEYKVNPKELLSSSRKRSLIYPRHYLMHLFHQNLGMSLSEIARYFKKDHSTVIYALKKISKMK